MRIATQFGKLAAAAGIVLLLLPLVAAPQHTCLVGDSPAGCVACLWTILTTTTLVLAAAITWFYKTPLLAAAQALRVTSRNLPRVVGRAPPSSR
jgi:hypothetical protein